MAADNISKFYSVFNEAYDNFKTEDEFRNWLSKADAEKMGNLYEAFNSEYDNFAKPEDMYAYLGWKDQSQEQGSPSAVSTFKDAPKETRKYIRQAEKEARKAEKARYAVSRLSDAPQETREYLANPFRGRSYEEIEALDKELVGQDKAFAEEYNQRRQAFQEKMNALSNVRGNMVPQLSDEDRAEYDWLQSNKERYDNYTKLRAQYSDAMSNTDVYASRMQAVKERTAKAREHLEPSYDINEDFPDVGVGITDRISREEARARDNDTEHWDSVERLGELTEQADKLGSKFDIQSAPSSVVEGVKQFAKAFGDSIDKDTITAGLAGASAMIDARDIAEKSNRITDEAIKASGYQGSAEDFAKLGDEYEAAVNELKPKYEELQQMVKDLDAMRATYEDMAKNGASQEELNAYYAKYQKKYRECSAKEKEYKPLFDKYNELQEQYVPVVEGITAALNEGLSESEKALLDALRDYTYVVGMRASNTSNAAKAGQGAEQSAEFMMDFILTKGLARGGAKVASKLMAKGLPKMAATVLSDMGVAAKRMALMFPRTLNAYGESLIQLDPEKNVDEFGRFNFSRGKANAALNSALQQYIEYWSEGFGEYFSAGEQKLFKALTSKAPVTAIGRTLNGYRGTIGNFLDNAKFNGMFNEMMEEVVGSLFTSTAGWLSGDRIGDSEAMKEFFAGDNLATLFMSFLPMSAFSAATNVAAYHKMKERYNHAVEVLNPLLKDGYLTDEDLESLTKDITGSTPEQIKDRIIDIADKVRSKNGGRLPQEFAQSLLGYVEGNLSMQLEGSSWEKSAEKATVAAAFADAYERPTAYNPWDANYMLQQTKDAALTAGVTEEELGKGAYRIAQDALAIKETEPEKYNAMMAYASAEATQTGIRDGFKRNAQNAMTANETKIRSQYDNNGEVITATLNGNLVYVTAKDAIVTADGKISVGEGGMDGLVTVLTPEGQTQTAKVSELSDAQATDTEAFIQESNTDIAALYDRIWQQAENTISTNGKAAAVTGKVGQTVYLSNNQGQGVYEPIEIVRTTNNGKSVVIRGSKGALDAVSTALRVNAPRGKQLEVDAAGLYNMLALDDNGQIATDEPAPTETAPAATAPAAPAAPAQQSQPAEIPEGAPALADMMGENYTIYINGSARNVSVTGVNERDGRISVMYQDAEGNDIATPEGLPNNFSYEEFVQAMQAPAAQEEAPVAEEPAPAVEEEKGPVGADGLTTDEWLEKTVPAMFADELTDADREDYIKLLEDNIKKQRREREALEKKRDTDKPKMTEDLAAYAAAKKALYDKYTQEMDALDAEIAENERRLNTLREAVSEINSRYISFVSNAQNARFSKEQMEPQTPEEAVAAFLSKNRNVRISRSDFRKETGYSKETKNFPFLFSDKSGMSIAALAEAIAAEYPGLFGGAANANNALSEGGSDNTGSDIAARDAIINFFSQVANNKDISNYIRRNRIGALERENEAQEGLMAAYIEETFGMTPEEYESERNRMIREDLEEMLAFPTEGVDFITNLQEFYKAKFNEDVRPEDNASGERENGGNEPAGTQSVPGGSSAVLQGQRPVGEGGPATAVGNTGAAEGPGADTRPEDGAPQGGSGLQGVANEEDLPFSRGAEAQRTVDPAKEPVRERLREWADRLGLKVNFIESFDEVRYAKARDAIARGEKVEAWFDPTTGAVEFYIPNVDAERVDALIMHEIITHKGLRGLFNKKAWNRLMDSVWNAMSFDQRTQWLKYNRHISGNPAVQRRAAADEFIAHYAEKVNLDNAPGGWTRFVALVKEALLRLGLRVNLSNDELSVLLAESLKRYESSRSDARSLVSDRVMRNAPQGNVMLSVTDNDGGRSLVGIHNISAPKLSSAIRTGGLANPSLAVIDLDTQDHEDYGDISLIAPSSMIDTENGRNAGTFTGDAWTPTYPGVTKQMTDAGWDGFWADMRNLPESLDSEVRNDWREYLENDRRGTSLYWWFLQDTGRTPETRVFTTDLSAEDRAIIESLRGKSESEILANKEDWEKAADLYRRLADPADVAHAEHKITVKEGRGRFTDYAIARNQEVDDYGMWTVPVFEMIDRLERTLRLEGAVDTRSTYNNAEQIVLSNNLREQFEQWLQDQEKRYGAKSKLFAGFTRDGDRIYLPNTVKNASYLMNREPEQNAYDNGGLSATKAMLLERLTTLQEIRDRKGRLAPRGEFDEEAYKEAESNWFNVINTLADMQKVDDNQFINIDIAESRLQEAIMQRNPIAYLNRNYRYSIPEKGEFADALAASLDEIRALPSKYFETKFNRPVYLNEFAAAVVPTDAPAEVRNALQSAGLPIYEYDSDKPGSRREATLRASEGDDIRFSISDPLDVAHANDLQKVPGKEYPVVLSTEEAEEDLLFSMTKNIRSTVRGWLDKREDLSAQQKQGVEDYIDSLNNPTLQLATGRWYTQGTLRLPEDIRMAAQAVAVASIAKVDPLRYPSPGELLADHQDIKLTEKPVDPDTVRTLHRAQEVPEYGVVIYDVDESEESRENMRRIVDTHFGEQANPWCLLQVDNAGRLTEDSAEYWESYSGVPKQVAFQNGKLLAFCASHENTREWWDRKDRPSYKLPITYKVAGDELKRKAAYDLDLDTGELSDIKYYFKGDKGNGLYEEWRADGSLLIREHYRGGLQEGLQESFNPDGKLAMTGQKRIIENDYGETDVNVGEWLSYFPDGTLHTRTNYDDQGEYDGVHEAFWPNGNLKKVDHFDHGFLNGTSERYTEDGILTERWNYVDGDLDGIQEEWYEDGTPKVRQNYKDGNREGREEVWYRNGNLERESEYKDGHHVGEMRSYNHDGSLESVTEYDENGTPRNYEQYFNPEFGGGLRVHRVWDSRGMQTIDETYHDNGQIWSRTDFEHGTLQTWRNDGTLRGYQDSKISEIYDDNGNLVSRSEFIDGKWQDVPIDAPIQFSIVTDQDEIDRLESEPKVTVYRAMELIDGELYPPMSQKEPNARGEKGKLKKRAASPLGAWERSDENPDKAYEKNGKWYFDLKKNAGSDVNGVLYNPYFHTSSSPLNDQFSAAHTRPNLVVVEGEIPESELTSGYKADKANDAVGPKDWHSGTVTAQLGEGRTVILSRWFKPVRVVPDSEVASIVAPKLKEKGVAVPYQVVTPGLRAALEEQGVDILDNEDLRFSIANANQEIFVSNAENAVESIKMEKATPEQWLNMLEKNGGLKAGEDKWLGLSDWLKASGKKTLTKQELLDFIGQNKIKIEEVHYSDLDNGEALKELQDEFDAIPFETNKAKYEDADRRVEAFYAEMEEKYGEDYLDMLTPPEQEIEERLLRERESYEGEQDPYEAAFDAMVEKYGDDFGIAFGQNGGKLYVNNSEAAEYYLGTKGINDTRLNYTTEDLDNKREIALTVPTIEPWGADDSIHFGDAGEGRAIAWARFGDTTVRGEATPEEVKDYIASLPKVDEWTPMRNASGRTVYFPRGDRFSKDFIVESNGRYTIYLNEVPLNTESTLEDAVKALNGHKASYRPNELKNRSVLFIDEIQSKRHQEGRDRGYMTPMAEDEQRRREAEYDTVAEEMNAKYGNGVMGQAEHWDEVSPEDKARIIEVRERYLEIDRARRGVRPAPFEKNWHELAMKRMLRLAAEEGYDYVAWTTGGQQAQRYNLGSVVSRIEVKPITDNRKEIEIYNSDGSYYGTVEESNGVIVSSGEDTLEGKSIDEVFGKDLAQKIIESTAPSTFNANDLVVGAEGMRGFYDEILPRFMNKYLKKWGVQVEDIDLPSLDLTAHSVRVTPEMKASIMEGQLMFSKSGERQGEAEAEAEEESPQMPSGLAGQIVLSHAIDSLADSFKDAVKVNAVSREQMPKGHKDEKGYYDTRTGEVYVCYENVSSIDDAIATIMHESVAHLGLRRLFGDQFPLAMTRIYAALSPEARMRVNASMTRNGWDAVTATEEYLASLAEKENFSEAEQTVWDRIKQIFQDVLARITGRDSVTLTDNDLRYILRASYLNLTSTPAQRESIQFAARERLLKNELGVNEYDEPEFLFRAPTFAEGTNAIANYNETLDNWWQKAQMEHQDAQQAVRVGINAIQAETGNKPIGLDEDYLTKENLSSSIARVEQDEFMLNQVKPLLEQIGVLIERIGGKKKMSRKERASAYSDIETYIYAKHAIERNRYSNARAAEQEAQADAEKMEKEGRHLTDAERAVYAPRDWSGLTALFGLDKSEYEEAERLAEEYCSVFEDKVGVDETDLLWDKIRALTDFNLKHALDHGLLTREEYDRLHGNESKGIKRMWEYYVPLRGFKEDTAEDVYSYDNFVNGTPADDIVKKYKGRTTLAEDPIANMVNIGCTNIAQGNANTVKQALYLYAINRPGNTLLTPRDVWYVKDAVTGKWMPAEPGEKESYDAFETKMQAAKEKHLARRGKKGLSLDMIMANPSHRNEHLIKLKVRGEEKGIWVNGNPLMAKAVNGTLRGQGMKAIRNITRALSNLFTTYSIDFAIRNFFRDSLYANMRLNAMSKENGRGYRRRFYKNWLSNGAITPIPMIKMTAQWENGTLQKKANPTEKERMFMDFMRDGGATGYTFNESVDKIKAKFEKELKMLKPTNSFLGSAWQKVKGSWVVDLLSVYPEAVSTLNEGYELLTRFTAYQTSRQMGKSGQEAAADAKEISVNFNRRGAQSGVGFWGVAAAYLGAASYFYNAGVQGFQNFGGLFKKHPWKMSTMSAMLIAGGFITPLINELLAGIGGGDDDDWYWDLPQWTRRNNIIIGYKGSYFAMPLGPEQKAIYGIGDIMAGLMNNRYADRSFWHTASDVVSQVSGILPVNPIEDYHASGSIGQTLLRTAVPDALMFIVDVSTNTDFTGKPLQKENPFNPDMPNCYSAYSSTPDGIVKACQFIAKESAKAGITIDPSPGYVRDAFKQYGGGVYSAIEKFSKLAAGIFNEDKPFRYNDIPLVSGVSGHLDDDRRGSFNTNALNEYKQFAGKVLRDYRILTGDPGMTASTLFSSDKLDDDPKYIQRFYDRPAFKLAQMYYQGMHNYYVQTEDGDVVLNVDKLKKEWRKLDAEYQAMPKRTQEQKAARAEKKLEAESAWQEYKAAESDLVELLLEYEAKHPAVSDKIESLLKKDN